jgi:hypothetical protein
MDLPVTATIQGSPTDVTLSYVVNYGPVVEVPMTSGTGGQLCSITTRERDTKGRIFLRELCKLIASERDYLALIGATLMPKS